MQPADQILEYSARALAGVKAYDLPATVARLGLALAGDPPPESADAQAEASAGKYRYALRRLQAYPRQRLPELAERVLAAAPAYELEEALARERERGRPTLSELTRRAIVDLLAARGGPEDMADTLDVVELLGRTWPLDRMPSTDPRCTTASGDIHQHTINNRDWSVGHLLLGRLGLLEASHARTAAFVESLVHPLARRDEAQAAIAAELDAIVAPDAFRLAAAETLSGRPVYRLLPREAGVQAPVKNLIFAAVHGRPKPDLVLADAVSNDVRIVRGEAGCLVYDRPIPTDGLTWAALVAWWAAREALPPDARATERALYDRLAESLDPGVEPAFFRDYFALFRNRLGERLPALVPQVYLHYDPRTVRERCTSHATGAGGVPLPRQRMDFLLLLAHGRRVVVEIDGRQHYATDDGLADTRRYADMVAADRELRFDGYEVYRVGGAELQDGRARATVERLFTRLFERHGVS